jgi:hypothetical protein
VYIVNSTHIVNGTLNVNETVQLANTAAETLLEADGEKLVSRKARVIAASTKGTPVKVRAAVH